MPKKKYDQFEIIEDPDAEPQRKPKRKRTVGPIYIPWRWVIWSFAGGVLGVTLVVGVVMLLVNPGRVDAPVPTSTVTLPPPPTPSVTPMPTLTGRGEYIRDIAWANGRMAAAGSNSLRVYNDVTHSNVSRWMESYGETARRVYNTIALSPDGSLVAGIATYSYPDGQVESDISMWNVSSGALLRSFKAHQGGNSSSSYSGDVNAIAFSPDNHQMITGAGDGQLIVWDTISDVQIAILPTGGIATWALAFQPASQLLSAFIQFDQQNFALQLWNIEDQQRVPRSLCKITMYGRLHSVMTQHIWR